MEKAVLATEIFAMIILAVILYGAFFESKQTSKKKSAFVQLVMGVFLTIFLDSLTYMPINWDRKYSLHYLLTMTVFITPFFIYAFFLHYIYTHISSKAIQATKLMFQIGECYCCVAAVLAAYCGLQGYIFNLDSNVYSVGEYYDVYMFTYALLLIYTMVIIGVNGKKLGLHDAIAALMFAIIPAFFIFFNIVFEDCAFMVPSLSISMLIIHVMLQGEQESALIAHDEANSILARRDEMTGLHNRLAYTEICDSMTREDITIGVVFGDVNGLKYTNDHFGHKKGDELLCEFANLLIGCFRKDDVFRISGDEFVVLLPGMPKELFEKKSKELVERIKDKEIPIASVGVAYGTQKEINHLIEQAEIQMYEDKKIFHEKYPNLSRLEK